MIRADRMSGQQQHYRQKILMTNKRYFRVKLEWHPTALQKRRGIVSSGWRAAIRKTLNKEGILKANRCVFKFWLSKVVEAV